MTKSKKIFRSKDQWQRILSEFNHSADTVEAFCRRRGLAYSTFKKWQQRLSEPTQEKASFYELRSVGDTMEEADNPWSMEIDMGDGRALRLKSNVDVHWVAQLLSLASR